MSHKSIEHYSAVNAILSELRAFVSFDLERKVWWRTVDNTSLCRLTQAGRCQQTRNRAYLGGGVGRRGGARSSTFVAPADAPSASCDARSRDDSGRQRPRVAPSADRDDCVA